MTDTAPLPPIRYPVSQPRVGGIERALVAQALAHHQLSQGPLVNRFEGEFAEWTKTRYAVSCANGTVALHLALEGLRRSGGVPIGSAVIVPALTYVATANAAVHAGLRVILADVDPDTWCLSKESLFASKITAYNVRAIIPVHLYGHLADVPSLSALAGDRKGTAVVEDAAEAHGATLHGEPAGSLGDAGVYSFYGNKILSCGEGGMITTRDARLAAACRHLRGHAMNPLHRYEHDAVGYNYRMTELQAAVGCGQLSDADTLHVPARRSIAHWYQQDLAGADLRWQQPQHGAEPVWWLPTVLLPEGCDRARVMAAMRAEGIETRPAFRPLCTLPMYAADPARFPVAMRVGSRGLSLPSYTGLTREGVEEISAVLKEALR